MHQARIGVIGVGSLGQHHARVYAALPDAALVAVVDTDAARARDLALQYSCSWFPHVQDLFGRVDAVSVAVPTPLHHPIAKACLEAGLHVLVEKPMTVSLEEADDLVASAAAKNLILQVGHIERFNSALRASLGAIKAPRLIECRRWAPFTPRGADVDVVLDLMIHDLDIVLSLIGGRVGHVEAEGISLLSRTTDVAHARVHFETGCVATFSASRLAEAKIRDLRVYEHESFLLVDLLGQRASIGRRVLRPGGTSKMLTESIRGDGQEPLKLELQAFLDSVRHGTVPLVSGEQGLSALRLAHTIMSCISRAGLQ
jgi:predicted dehydrogenase